MKRKEDRFPKESKRNTYIILLSLKDKPYFLRTSNTNTEIRNVTEKINILGVVLRDTISTGRKITRSRSKNLKNKQTNKDYL